MAITALLSVGFLLQGTWALAATTGGLAGIVHDDTGAPVAGATVTVTSPSQTATVTTDAQGHFVFLVLQPDTYIITVKKSGYQTVSIAGNAIFADQVQQVVITAPRAISVIAHVRTRASALVKSGIGNDVYSVSSAQVTAAQPLGGGSQLNTAYSAIASVPGVAEFNGGMAGGWNFSGVFIRGQQYYFTSYEYDGVPVNRAFDNYNGSEESNLGLQELQVYTGGGPASNSSPGTSGFINEVIKTGTYPGYATVSAAIAAETFYHAVTFEAGGATPDRNFSYYVGISGNDQAFRFLDQQDGASYMTPGGIYAGYGYAGIAVAPVGFGTNGVGDRGLCALNSVTPLHPNPTGTSGCWNYFLGSFGQESYVSDREDVVNLHFGIPRRSGQRDDVQLLWSASAMSSQIAGAPQDAGGYNALMWDESAAPYAPPSSCAPTALAPMGICGGGNYPSYADAYVYNLPFGTNIAGKAPLWYYAPGQPHDTPVFAQLPLTTRDTISNDMGTVKLQWTHPFSDNAFMRVFVYTMYSDWLQFGPQDTYTGYLTALGPGYTGVATDYELPTHTAGGEIQFQDQINDQNLVALTANYVTANTTRWYNTGYLSGSSPIGYVALVNGNYNCYAPKAYTDAAGNVYAPGQQMPCIPVGGYNGFESNSITGPTGSPACAGGVHCYWASLWNGDANGSFNTVQPRFTFVSLTDEWRPNDRWMVDAGLRYDRYSYGLANSNTPWTNFYAQFISQAVCVNGAGTVYSYPLAPGAPPPAPVHYTLTCPTGYAHPPFTGASPSVYTIDDWSARGAVTYTAGPNTVFRLSAGRFTAPPVSSSVQYLASSGNEASVWEATLPLGFDSPFHPIPAMSSGQYDFSWEQRVPNTDVSFKITPFYSHISAYQEQAFIGQNFATNAPVGQFRSYGVEGALSVGDFASNGLAAQLSLTYTNAKVQYQWYYGTNQIATTNTAIAAYNALTRAGGGSPCYSGGVPAACSGTTINNPYYNMPEQPLLATDGWYAPGRTGLSPTSNPSTSYYDAPWVGDVILNWRTNRLAITPSLQYVEGSSYGGPMDFTGIDPRTCGANQGTTGVVAPTAPTAGNCDWTTMAGAASNAAGVLYIPNPQTGEFTAPGAYQNPSLVTANLGITYDVSPRLRLALTATNIFHTCFGGSKESWTNVYPPNGAVCGYSPNGAYVSNFYNGTSPNDVAANGNTPYPWQLVSYAPTSGSVTTQIPLPFNLYIQAQIHL